MKNILENIEAIRKEKGLNQAVVAEALGVKQPAYSNYITRNSDIYFNRLSQIADALGVSVIDIITYPDIYIKKEDIIREQPIEAVLQIKLQADKKEQVLKLVFGENNLEILNK